MKSTRKQKAAKTTCRHTVLTEWCITRYVNRLVRLMKCYTYIKYIGEIMKIRDSHNLINGIDETIEFKSRTIDIVADDGRTMFSLSIDGNELTLYAGNICKHAGAILDDRFVIKPKSGNCVTIVKTEYTGK